MLVVGSRGRGHRVGRLMGSSGREVLDNALCPVAIVGQDQAPAAPPGGARRAEVHNMTSRHIPI
jgi:hypothetical protein